MRILHEKNVFCTAELYTHGTVQTPGERELSVFREGLAQVPGLVVLDGSILASLETGQQQWFDDTLFIVVYRPGRPAGH